jgi:tripartite-type tricarboxylate transporter receptor subunit TctC
VEQIRGTMIKALADSAFKAKLVAIGLDVAQPGTSKAFAEFIRGEIDRMGEVVRVTGMVSN